MSSWQANAVSFFMRIMSKSALRVTSVDFSESSVTALRRQTRYFNEIFGKLPLDARIEPAALPFCQADWISVPESDPRRVILHLPGGAFLLRTPSVHRALTVRLCRQARARALLVHYRLAPENPFPAGLRDCIAAYRFLLEQAIRPQQIVLGGDSAGGALALSTLLALRDDAVPLPAGAYLLSPVTDLTEHHEGSRRENRWLDPMLIPGRQTMRLMYVEGNESLLRHPHVSPAYGDYSGFPPLLFQVGDTEILRDDSVRVAEKARAAGVSAEVEIWKGVPHVWHALAFLPEAERALSRIGEFARSCTAAIDLETNPTEDTQTTP